MSTPDIFCPQCGARNPGHGTFCSSCGHRLLKDTARETQMVDFWQPKTPNNPMPAPAQTAYGNANGGSYGNAGQAFGQDFASADGDVYLTVFEGDKKLCEINPKQFGKSQISFGSAADNDVVVATGPSVASRHHGTITPLNGCCHVDDAGSRNGLFVNGLPCKHATIYPGDVIAIGKMGSANYACVAILAGRKSTRWETFALHGFTDVSVGRSKDNDISFDSPSVSSHHMRLQRRGDQWFAIDMQSLNGTYVSGNAVLGERALMPGDIISLSGRILVFTGTALLYGAKSLGVEINARNLTQIRKVGKKSITTTDNVSLDIGRGEFVAIVGGSGSGKSTLLNELNGSDPAVKGTVTVNGVDLYSNYSRLKNSIGYVPQQDIVYDNLTVRDMLTYAAKLRMNPDCSAAERAKRIDEVLEILELTNEQQKFIRQLSGGQKKRASIAVELLADPRLLFLDEPTSGLDPGIEASLMKKLAALAHDGRTIILVTHTPANLHLCDKIVFLGPGGKLCYTGPSTGAAKFFGTGDDFSEIYSVVAAHPDQWKARFTATQQQPTPVTSGKDSYEGKGKTPGIPSQIATLSARYAKLLINDRTRSLLLILQAPLLALLICLVADDDCFSVYESTKSCLFSLSCAAFWVGMLNSIQEICKEKVIFTREYAGGVKVPAYIASKIIVLGALCVLQALLLTVVFMVAKGAGMEGLLSPGIEMFITMLLVTFSAMCLGLAVSALFQNPDRAIAMAPIFIMPQILFSGLVFKLEGAAKGISYFVNCRWGMEALGTSANLNALDLKLYGEEVTLEAQDKTLTDVTVDLPDMNTSVHGQSVTVDAHSETFDELTVPIPEQTETIDGSMYAHDAEDAYTFTLLHLLASWEILVLFCVVCTAAAGFLVWRGQRR